MRIPRWEIWIIVPIVLLLTFIAANQWLPGFSEMSAANRIPWVLAVGTICVTVARWAFPHYSDTPLTIDYQSPRSNASTFELLSAHNRLTGVIGRDAEQKTLRNWATPKGGKRDISAMLISGDGGLGKTRLSLDLAANMGKKWNAGNARLNTPPQAIHQPTLCLVDYPEEHFNKVETFLKAVNTTATNRHPLRVILISRHDWGWWLPHLQKWGVSGLFNNDSMPLSNLTDDFPQELFISAYISAHANQTGNPPQTPNRRNEFAKWFELNPGMSQNSLFVIACAVSLVENPNALGLTTPEIIDDLVQRELARINREGEQAGLEEGVFRTLIAMSVIAEGLNAKALKSIADQADALELNLPDAKHIVTTLQKTKRTVGTTLPTLRPDIVAAHLAVTVLNEDPDLAPERLWTAVELNLTDLADRLGRMIHDQETVLGQPQLLVGWLTAAIQGNVTRCIHIRQITDHALLPSQLHPLSLEINWTIASSIASPLIRATHLDKLGTNLSNLGRFDDAFQATKEAVSIYYQCEFDNQSSHTMAFTVALGNLGNRLSQIGDLGFALTATLTAIRTLRPLFRNTPDEHRRNQAVFLDNLGVRRSKLGQYRKALPATKKALAIRRKIAEDQPGLYDYEVAYTLNNLSIHFAQRGNDPEALKAARESVDIWEPLISEYPEAFRPDYATALGTFALCLANMGFLDDAIHRIKKAETIYRQLEKELPGTNISNIATMSNNRAGFLTKQGHIPDAIQLLQDTIAMLMPHCHSKRHVYEAIMSTVFTHYGTVVEQTGKIPSDELCHKLKLIYPHWFPPLRDAPHPGQ